MSHRRRGVGVGRSTGAKFSKKAEEIKATSFQSAVETVENWQVKLGEFAKKHRSEIQDDPAFHQQFLQGVERPTHQDSRTKYICVCSYLISCRCLLPPPAVVSPVIIALLSHTTVQLLLLYSMYFKIGAAAAK